MMEKKIGATGAGVLLGMALAGALPAHAQRPTMATVASGPTLSLALRREIFNLVWSKVNDSYYDPKFGGLDWNAVKTKYAPKVDKAPNDAAFYGALQQMLGELKQSHFAVIPPDSFREEAKIKAAANSAPTPPPDATPSANPNAGPGTVGAVVQIVEGRPTITRITEGSGAQAAGLKPGYILTTIAGQPIATFLDAIKKRAKTEREYATLVRLNMEGVLAGLSGSTVAIGYLDGDDKPQTATVTRGPVAGKLAQFGALPPIFVNVDARRVTDNIGYIGFNVFLRPIVEPIYETMEMYADAPGVILDVRGNPGGLGILAITVARNFYGKEENKEINLGSMRQRQGNYNFLVNPVEKPFTGPVAILTDEGSASTSEILAGGMKETGRAVTVGSTTAGEALPSQIEILPGGGRLQYAVADLKTPKGNMIEGAGITPTIPVKLTRRDLLTGRDPVLDAAVAYIQAHATPPATPAPNL